MEFPPAAKWMLCFRRLLNDGSFKLASRPFPKASIKSGAAPRSSRRLDVAFPFGERSSIFSGSVHSVGKIWIGHMGTF
jgi:hypothetical protein